MRLIMVLLVIAALTIPLRWGLICDTSGAFHVIDKGFLGKGPLYRDLSGIASPEVIASIAAKGQPFQIHWNAWSKSACESRVAAYEAKVRTILAAMPLALAVKAGPLAETIPEVIGQVTPHEGGIACPSGGGYVYSGGEDGHVLCDYHKGRDARMNIGSH